MFVVVDCFEPGDFNSSPKVFKSGGVFVGGDLGKSWIKATEAVTWE